MLIYVKEKCVLKNLMIDIYDKKIIKKNKMQIYNEINKIINNIDEI